jgi:hypothetical protein
VSVLSERLIAVHDALSAAGLPHAFGGAIALAYCTEEPRGTRDLDVNVFVDPKRASEIFLALPEAVTVTAENTAAAERDGQVRVWWDDTPIDLFFDVHALHDQVAGAIRWVPFSGATIPVLGCTALTVFKALFNRTRDWADIEAMIERDAVDVPEAVAWIERLLGGGDPAAVRLASLVG